jgi:hypothetical protein
VIGTTTIGSNSGGRGSVGNSVGGGSAGGRVSVQMLAERAKRLSLRLSVAYKGRISNVTGGRVSTVTESSDNYVLNMLKK